MTFLSPPPPPGWYPDPTPAPTYRWWSGVGWTEYVWPGGMPGPGAGGVGYAGPSGGAAASAGLAWAGGSSASALGASRASRPRKWLGRWGGWLIVAGSAAIWLWLFGLSLLFSALAPHAGDGAPAVLSPFLLVTGSGTVAAAIFYTMAYKLRPADGLSVPRLVAVALLGGTLATLLVLPLEGFIDLVAGGTAQHPSLAVLASAGAVEELVKLLCAMLLCIGIPVKNARVGLFVGGAVGLGFSVVENLGYLQQAYAIGQEHGSALGQFLFTVAGREITGPFLHPVFSALLAAAVFGAARGGRYRITLGVVGVYLAVSVAHGLFNTVQWAASEQLLGRYGGLLLLLADVILLLASGVAWLVVVRRIRMRDARDALAAQLPAMNASSAA